MRILIINCVSDRCELGLYRGLHDLGHTVRLLVDPRETETTALNEYGIAASELHIRNRFDFRAVKALKSILAEEKFDLIFAPTSRGITAAIRASRGSNIPLLSYRGTLGNLHRFDPIARLAHLSPRVGGIICLSEAVNKFMQSVGVPKEKLFTVMKGHDPEWYRKTPPASLQEFDISSDDFVITCVANIRPLKGIDVLIKAVSQMPADSKAHLLLVGDYKKGDKTLKLPQKLGIESQVTFTGFRPDAVSILASADVSVMPSLRREGLSRAVSESKLLGIPAIVSNIGGMPEIIRDGIDGYVVPAGDSKKLSQRLTKLAREPELCEQFSKQTALHAEQCFLLDNYVQKIEQAMLSLV